MSSVAERLPVSPSRPLDVLADHRLLAPLGRGGMAEIYLATRPSAFGTELVVVKRLHPEDVEEPAVVRMFVDEALISLRLKHPSIVRAHQLGLIEGRHALVMEYLEGQPLQALMKRCSDLGRALPMDAVVPAFIDVLDGLQHAHDLRDEDGRPLHVIHRDVSPHNLFVTTLGNVKLLDFGIAKTRLQQHHTRAGTLKGKVAYMAPEQAHGDRIDHRADLWSTGVALWEAIAGARLFKADGEMATLRQTLKGPIPSLSSVRPDVPPEVEAVVMQALRREPHERFASAAEMAAGLRDWAEDHGIFAATPLRDVMAEIFGRETAEHRVRLRALVASDTGAAPVSSSVPALVRHLSPESTPTHVSTMTDFVEQLHQSQRTAFRRMFLLLSLLGVAVIALGVALALRERDAASARLAPVPQVAVAAAVAPLPVQPPSPAAPAVMPVVTPMGAAAEAEPADIAPIPRKGGAPLRSRRAQDVRTQEPPAVSLAPAPVPAPAPRPSAAAESPRFTVEPGFLTLDSSPWSQVTADGVALGQTPIVRAKLAPGTHTLRLVNPDEGVSTTYQVTIESGKTTVRRLGLD